MPSDANRELLSLEAQLEADPSSEPLREEILFAYFTAESAGHPRRIEHITEYVRRFPRNPVARSPLVSVDPATYPDAFGTVEREWIQHQHDHPNDPQIARGFASFVASADPARAAMIMEEALLANPEDAGLWLDLGRARAEPRLRLHALQKARALGASQPNLLPWIARAAIESGELAVAEQVGAELLLLVQQARSIYGEKLDWREHGQALWQKASAACDDHTMAQALVRAIGDHANQKHWAHTTLGVLALRRGDIKAASHHLLESSAVVGEPRLSSYGPSFLLARELCQHGEWDVVGEYLRNCETFWNDDRLQGWVQAVEQRKVPHFAG